MIPAFFLPGGSITVTRETYSSGQTDAGCREPLTIGELVESLFNELVLHRWASCSGRARIGDLGPAQRKPTGTYMPPRSRSDIPD